MIIVETMGLYHYEVTGEQEQAAAVEFQECYDFLCRTNLSGDSFLVGLSDARKRISQKYGVTIKTV